MQKRHTDKATNRPIITFYYPMVTIARLMTKETSFKMRIFASANSPVASTTIFNRIADNEWFLDAAKSVMNSLLILMGKMNYGISPQWASFVDKPVNGSESMGVSVNDYRVSDDAMLAELQEGLQEIILNTMMILWLENSGRNEMAAEYIQKNAAARGFLARATKLLKRKKTMQTYPPKYQSIYGDSHSMSTNQ